MRRLVAAALALTCAVGGGGVAAASVAAGDGPLSKKEFVAEVNEICRDVGTVLDAVAFEIFSQSPPGEPPSDELIEQFVEILVPAYDGLHDKIEDLGAPAGDTKKIKRMLATLQREIDAVADDAQRLSLPTGPFPKFEKLARKYGLAVCAPE